MSTTSITFNSEAAERSINRFTRRKPSTGEWRLIPLGDLFARLSAAGAITTPRSVHIVAEEHRVAKRDRVRIVLTDHARSEIGVTSDHDRAEFATERLSKPEVLVTVARLVRLGNDLLAARHAMKVGEDRITGEVDYSDPENLIGLLENRDCQILDRAAIEAAVSAEPGPFVYTDVELCDGGGTWENTGARWANRLERRLAEQGAIKCP